MSRPWWEPWDLPDGHERAVRLGPLRVRVARAGGLIRVAHRSDDDERDEVHLGDVAATGPAEADERVERFAAAPPGPVQLRPLTADRPVVSRPEVPLVVLPGSRLDVYVATPVWASLVVGGVPLVTLPIRTPKPTFFGTPTHGTVAWSMRTVLRVDLANVEPRPHRAITPVEIHNTGDDPLRVERLLIPVPRLSVHADPEGVLWTGSI